jgi:hypothetical protein
LLRANGGGGPLKVGNQESKMMKAKTYVRTATPDATGKLHPIIFKGKPVVDENGNYLQETAGVPKGTSRKYIEPMNIRAIRNTPKDPPTVGQSWPPLGGIDLQTYLNYLQTEKNQSGPDVVRVASKAYRMGYGKGLRGRDLYCATWDGLANIFGDMPIDSIPEGRYVKGTY